MLILLFLCPCTFHQFTEVCLIADSLSVLLYLIYPVNVTSSKLSFLSICPRNVKNYFSQMIQLTLSNFK